MRSGNFWVGAREQAPYVNNNTPDPVTPAAPSVPAPAASPTPMANPAPEAINNFTPNAFDTPQDAVSHTGFGQATDINPNWQQMRERYQNRFGNMPRAFRPMALVGSMMGGQSPWNDWGGQQQGSYQNTLADLLSRWGQR